MTAEPTPRPDALTPVAADGLAIGLVAAVAVVPTALVVAWFVGSHTDALLARLLAGTATVWLVLLGACWLAARRSSEGLLRRYGFRLVPVDLAVGLAAAFAARVVATAVTVVLLLLFGRELVGSNVGGIVRLRSDRSALLAFWVLATVGAPLVEELFYRGLLLRALQARLATPMAVGAQAALFALAHSNPVYGLRNVGVVLQVLVFGIIAGMLAVHFRRLGPSIAAHAINNAVVTLVVVLATS